MKFKTPTWLLGGLLIMLQLQLHVTSDYLSLLKCGQHKDCWPHLDIEIVATIRDNIRNATQPCDNFWQHACGDWKPPSGEPHYSDNFGFAMEDYVKRFQELLTPAEKLPINMNNIKTLVGKLSTYYQRCIGIKSKYPNLLHYFSEMPIQLHEQWPNYWQTIIESNTSQQNFTFNWLQTIAALRQYGLNGVFLAERATVAFNDSTRIAIELKMPDDGDQIFEKKFELVNYFVDFRLVAGPTDRLWDLAAQIFELDRQLKELRSKHKRDEDATYEEAMNLTQLKEKIPSIDWQSYFNVLLGQVHVSGTIPIEVNGIGYFRELSALIEQTDDKILALYILMHICKYILEIRTQTSAQHCLDHMGTLMPLGLNYMYDRFIYETRLEDVQTLDSIFRQLKGQFQQYLNSNKLHLNEVEQRYLVRKLHKMSLQIGNLPLNLSVEYYNEYYASVNITENFYRNHWEMLRFRMLQQHSGFLRHEAYLNLDTFYVYDDINQMRNAPYYLHERNLLMVPMIFMHLPFFHHSMQPLFQFSLVGFILGHEFNHAFENDGIIMDADGNESPIGFAIKRKNEFISNVKCFRQTETASLVERMADVNGFQLAYDAYFGDYDGNSVAENVLDETVGFLEDFTEKQLFFLNFAQFFCGELPIPIDHDADDVRVNEIVRNMPEFLETFRCTDEEVKANETDICEMWRS